MVDAGAGAPFYDVYNYADFGARLTDYLHGLGQLIDFGVDWDNAAKLISIRTDKGCAA